MMMIGYFEQLAFGLAAGRVADEARPAAEDGQVSVPGSLPGRAVWCIGLHASPTAAPIAASELDVESGAEGPEIARGDEIVCV
jgi:hypothetical protein